MVAQSAETRNDVGASNNAVKVVPSLGAVYLMGILLATFTFFFTKSVKRNQ
ncbi:hypothetical protein C7445_1233 [Alicyclobacillus sacchari]|uniref:Uncharacterized protein n=1 Tax=Alicyclobacillus sacchari TaxID=392010 RepID=A0A4R8LBC3_9BACL|nr:MULTISPECIES: hypothetical protein [Alicyclobacillus]EJY55878.1 hypothetical protein URH17368_1454 [Alicyclobacillus hesperidum URH17-3-68]TDY40232.1 hypothetical protein C7445_1233 [Alicyclobacillus sacchari]GMA59242.1 hypothetical protein GCM10025858_37450 [Alicyclobacillus sacchari]GMA59383.1 hypothetical protein GCM10025858_38860 [Alicyclobacillus sacchari]